MNENNKKTSILPFLSRDSRNMKRGERDAIDLLACQAMAKLTLDLVYRNDRIRSTGKVTEDFLFLPASLDFSVIEFLLPGTKFFRFGEELYKAYHSFDLGAFRKCIVRKDLHKFRGVGATTSARMCDIFTAPPHSSWTGLNQRYFSLRVSRLQNGLSDEMSTLGILVNGLDDSGADGLPRRYVMRYASILRLFIDAADDVYSYLQTGRWLHPDIARHYNEALLAYAKAAAPDINPKYLMNKELYNG